METRFFTQSEILNSKGYVKGMINYPTPNIILDGLMNIEEQRFNILLKGDYEVININDDGTENISFGRLDLQYRMNLDEMHSYTIGLIIALDKGKPIAKVYSGMEVKTCLNLCIFGADQVNKFDISTNPEGYKIFFQDEFKRIEAKAREYKAIKRALENTHFSQEEVHKLNGALLYNILENNGIAGTNPLINAIKLQTEKHSIYYSKDGLNAWLFYNSLTEYLAQKVHILDIPEKALNIFATLKQYINIPKYEEDIFNEVTPAVLELAENLSEQFPGLSDFTNDHDAQADAEPETVTAEIIPAETTGRKKK